jgi:hypothetical protein
LKRFLAALSSGAIGAALLVVGGPAAPAGATVNIVQGYSCTTSGGTVVPAKVRITGTGLVNTTEEPTEKFRVKNVIFTVKNPFGVAITVNTVVVTVPDPATVVFLSGSTIGPGWVFTHPGAGPSTDTHAAALPPVAAGGSFSNGAMRMRYPDVNTDPPGPGVVNWFGGTISFNVVAPPGIGGVTCTPTTPMVPFASAKDPV